MSCLPGSTLVCFLRFSLIRRQSRLTRRVPCPLPPVRRSTGLSPASDRHPARSHRAAFPSHPWLWHEAESVLSLPPAPCPPGAASTRLSLAAAASPGLGSAPVLLRLLHWSRLFFLILLMFSVTLSHCSAVSSVPPIFSVNPAVHSVLPRLGEASQIENM